MLELKGLMDTECQNISAFYDALGDACNDPSTAECSSALTQALVEYGKPCLDLSYLRGDPAMPPFRYYACAEATGPLAALCDLDPSGTPSGAAAGGIDWDAPVTVTTGQATVGAVGAVGGAAAIAAAAAAAGRRSAPRGANPVEEATRASLCTFETVLCLDPNHGTLDPVPEEGEPEQVEIAKTKNAENADLRSRLQEAAERTDKSSSLDLLDALAGKTDREKYTEVFGDDITEGQVTTLDGMMQAHQANLTTEQEVRNSMQCYAFPLSCRRDMPGVDDFKEKQRPLDQALRSRDFAEATRLHRELQQQLASSVEPQNAAQHQTAIQEVRNHHEQVLKTQRDRHSVKARGRP